VRVITWNCQRGLVPTSDMADMRGKLDYAHSLFLEYDLDFLCIQEFGARRNSVNTLITNKFQPCSVWAGGAEYSDERYSKSGVGLIIEESCEVQGVSRHPSGRAICAVVKKDGREFPVLSVHLPAGLDTAGYDTAAPSGC
jgi:hypothetical protein